MMREKPAFPLAPEEEINDSGEKQRAEDLDTGQPGDLVDPARSERCPAIA